MVVLTLGHHLPEDRFFLNGTMGVDIFFALSGWLITWLILSEQARWGRIDLKAFYIRRFFRIVPMYYLTIFLYFIATIAMARIGRPEDGARLANVLPYLMTFNFEYVPRTVEGIFGHAWTLGIEEKFYLLWPLFLVLFGRRILLLGLMLIGAVVLLMWLKQFSPFLLRGYLGLGFGAALAFATKRHQAWVVWLQSAWFAWAMVGAIMLVYLASLFARDLVIWNLGVSFFGAGLVASLWFSNTHIPSRMLQARPLAFMGRLTYSMYLLHVLVINVTVLGLSKVGVDAGFWLVYGLAYTATGGLSYALFRGFESPLIAFGRRLAAKGQQGRVPVQ